jgi:hypothetical protein
VTSFCFGGYVDWLVEVHLRDVFECLVLWMFDNGGKDLGC